ncbi:MAG: hypothetical protein CM15mP25_0640 [Gammaproteobacteria bacterium]|nr:MAG: hypothetical protein CM15mP25_0640 [Gammaproteobacteria bacterium]
MVAAHDPSLARVSRHAIQSRRATAPYCHSLALLCRGHRHRFWRASGALRVVPNGVDTELFKPLPSVTRKPGQIIATASADAPLKGLPVLLHAFKRLVEAEPERQLVLIARPKAGGDTEALIERLGLFDHIRFVGDASHEEINRLYAESAVAVVPSLYEGFGLPAVEAMAAGFPPGVERWRCAGRGGR